MASKKKYQVSIWVLISVVIIAIALIAMSFFIAKGMYDKPQNQVDRVSKWGMTIDLKKETNSIDYHVNHSETNDSLTIDLGGKYRCPEPGETTIIDTTDVHGTSIHNMSSDMEGSISFPAGSFMKNNVFTCPLIFNLGRDKDGNPVRVDGYDYIGKKDALEQTLNKVICESDIALIPANTNLEKTVNDLALDSHIEYPKDREDKDINYSTSFYDYKAKLVVKMVF